MRTRTDAPRTDLRVIELAGPPGAGKTALLPTVVGACEAVGLRPYTVDEAARVFARRTPLGRLTSPLPPAATRRTLWGIYYWGSAVGALRLAGRRPQLVSHLVRSQRRRPADADAARRRVGYWFYRMAGGYAFLLRHGRPGEALIIDEGFVHRTVQLHSSAVEHPDPTLVAEYATALPATDLVVVVHAPVALCQRRVRERGVWRRWEHRSATEIDRFVANAHAAIDIAAAHLRATARSIVEIDNTGDLTDAEVELKARVQETFADHTTDVTAPVRWRPPLRVPRLGRARRLLRPRPRTAPADAAAWTAILARYGVAAAGRGADTMMGQRNRNVVLDSSAGRVVLRRYRDVTPTDSVLHEHAVLVELERRAFPAVRLRRTLAGDTLVHHDDGRYAVFDFVDAHNLGSWVIPRAADRARLYETAGRTLARLHRELQDFVPDAAHHLGFAPGTRRRLRDLEWYLEALTTLPTRVPPAGPAGEEHRTLAAMADRIAADLAEVDDVIAQADLPVTTIHGDYGIHNLLFRRHDRAVVADFELARRELRLVDLIIVLSRVPHSDGLAFLSGYRREGDIPPAEWALLPDVWRHYRLVGAIASWHNHVTHGGTGRLATALRRLAEADWAAAEVESRWP